MTVLGLGPVQSDESVPERSLTAGSTARAFGGIKETMRIRMAKQTALPFPFKTVPLSSSNYNHRIPSDAKLSSRNPPLYPLISSNVESGYPRLLGNEALSLQAVIIHSLAKIRYSAENWFCPDKYRRVGRALEPRRMLGFRRVALRTSPRFGKIGYLLGKLFRVSSFCPYLPTTSSA